MISAAAIAGTASSLRRSRPMFPGRALVSARARAQSRFTGAVGVAVCDLHINADIAAAVARYRSVTGDETLETEVELELLVETARLWISLGHHDLDGVWHIAGVTGRMSTPQS